MVTYGLQELFSDFLEDDIRINHRNDNHDNHRSNKDWKRKNFKPGINDENETCKHHAFSSESMRLIPDFLIIKCPRKFISDEIILSELSHEIPENDKEDSDA